MRTMSDLIDRQQAIDAVADGLKGIFVEYRDIAEKMIGKLPSAKSTQTNADSTHTNALDCVNRQAAIDEIRMCDYGLESWQKWKLITMLKDIPSAQQS